MLRKFSFFKITLFCVLLVFVAFNTAVAEKQVVDIIELGFQQANELVHVIEPILEEGGTVTPYKNQLIIKSSPDNIKAIKQVIQRLDKTPRRMLISVKSNEQKTTQSRAVEVDVNVGNDHVALKKESIKTKPSSATINIINNNQDKIEDEIQQVRVVEGYPAFIQVGQLVPFTTNTIDSYGYVVESVDLVNVTHGFYVNAQTVNKEVVVEISVNRDDLALDNPNIINTQQTVTTVRGDLGQWIDLSQIKLSANVQDSEIFGYQRTRKEAYINIKIKVDLIN